MWEWVSQFLDVALNQTKLSWNMKLCTCVSNTDLQWMTVCFMGIISVHHEKWIVCAENILTFTV